MVKKPLVKRGATVKHDNHYEAPEIKVERTSVATSKSSEEFQGRTVRVKDFETYVLLRALVKANLAATNSVAIENAVKAYVNGLDESDKQEVRKIAEAYKVLENF